MKNTLTGLVALVFGNINLNILGTEATLHRDLFPVFSLKDTVLGSLFSKQDSSMFCFFLKLQKESFANKEIRDSEYSV